MNISEFIKNEFIGKVLLETEFSDGENDEEWRGKLIKDAFIAQDECREDAVLWITFDDDEECFFYLNDTFTFKDSK